MVEVPFVKQDIRKIREWKTTVGRIVSVQNFYFERNYHSLICELPLLAIFLVPASHTSSPDMLTFELTLKTNIRFTKMLKKSKE